MSCFPPASLSPGLLSSPRHLMKENRSQQSSSAEQHGGEILLREGNGFQTQEIKNKNFLKSYLLSSFSQVEGLSGTKISSPSRYSKKRCFGFRFHFGGKQLSNCQIRTRGESQTLSSSQPGSRPSPFCSLECVQEANDSLE